MSSFLTLRAVSGIGGVAVVISSAELLQLRHEFSDKGLFCWRENSVHTNTAHFLRTLYQYPNVLALLMLRLAGGGLCMLSPGRDFLLLGACLVVASSLLLTKRGPHGRNGADSFSSVTFVAVALGFLSNDDVVRQEALWFLVAQLCLSYITAGALKLFEPSWRDGSAVRWIVQTESYGHPQVARFIGASSSIAVVTAWLVIGFECAFPLVLVLPLWASWTILVFGLIFHIANAAVIGLNTFLWSFVAIYPAVVWCASRVCTR